MLYPDTINLSTKLKDHLKNTSSFELYKKGQLILHPNDEEVKAFFIKEGTAKLYRFNNKGGKEVVYFFKENEVVTSVQKFFDNRLTTDYQPEDYIEVLEDSALYSITKAQFDYSCILFSEANRLAADILVAYSLKTEQHVELLSRDAYERYAAYCKSFPCARLAVTDLLSFLHISKAHLARIKR